MTNKLKFRPLGIPCDKHLVIALLRGHDTTPIVDVLPLVKEVNEKYKSCLKLINPRLADYLLKKTSFLRQTFPDDFLSFPTDAVIGFESPGKKLGEKIVFASEDGPRLVFPTGDYKGEKDIALVALGLTEEYMGKDGADLVLDVPDWRLTVVPDFPIEDGWYLPYAQTTVPHGEKVRKFSAEARYLWGRKNTPSVGPIVRRITDTTGPFYPCEDAGSAVLVGFEPAYKVAVIVETSRADAKRILLASISSQ